MKIEENGTVRTRSGLRAAIEYLKNGISSYKGDAMRLLCDVGMALVAYLLAKTHTLFGAYPLGIALVCTLHKRVWIALIGVALGSLGIGTAGIVYALISVIAVLLRVFISGKGSEEGARLRLFDEGIGLRASVSVICAALMGVYGILLWGFDTESVLYAAAMVLLTPLVTLLLAPVFNTGVSPDRLLRADVNTLFPTEDTARHRVLFVISSLVLVLLTGLSLAPYSLFGVDLTYIFASVLMIGVAKRFRQIASASLAALVGFVAACAESLTLAPAFALAGAAVGALFGFGLWPAVLCGAIALGAYASSSGGISALLGTLPEYAVGAALVYPLLSHITTQDCAVAHAPKKPLEDMIGTMTYAYRAERESAVLSLEDSLRSMSQLLEQFGSSEGDITPDECREIVADCYQRSAQKYTSRTLPSCAEADGDASPTASREGEVIMEFGIEHSPCEEQIEILTTKLYNKEEILPSDAPSIASESFPDFLSQLRCALARLESSKYKKIKTSAIAEQYELIARLINGCRRESACEGAIDEEASERLCESLTKIGLGGCVVRVIGQRRRMIMVACEDADGTHITSPEVSEIIERELSVKLSTAEYFRRDSYVLMRVFSAPRFSVKAACAQMPRSQDVCGDTVCSFDTDNGSFFSMLCDGMGTGESAKEVSGFLCSAGECMLRLGDADTVLHILNKIVLHHGKECSATVDLFSFDRLTGSATFTKCGAADSYIKRGESIFRIRSGTSPIGQLSSLDGENMRVDIERGDYIFMLSDGVADGARDATWLIEYLSSPSLSDLDKYAQQILCRAACRGAYPDDMSVCVLHIE